MQKNINLFYDVNSSIGSTYKELFPLKKITKNKLRIIAGIEMYFGNMDEVKYLYASKEIKELEQFINHMQNVKKLMDEANMIMLSNHPDKLAKAEEKHLQASKEQKRSKEMKDKLVAKESLLLEYGIKITDLDELEKRFR